MSKQSESKAGTNVEEVPECPDCGKPLPLCICDSITPIESKVSLLILQHPQEQDRTLGTARLLAVLQKRPDIAETLNGSFERLLARYREVQTTMPELAPKPKKRDYRRRKGVKSGSNKTAK